jgi:hypothetical protein
MGGRKEEGRLMGVVKRKFSIVRVGRYFAKTTLSK